MEIHLTNASLVVIFFGLFFFVSFYFYFHHKFKEVKKKISEKFMMSETKQKEITQLESLHEEVAAAMDNQKKLLDGILSHSLDGFWDWKIKEDYEYMSPRFKSMFGYEPDELEDVPDTWMKLIHPYDLSLALERFEDHVSSKGEKPYQLIARYNHKDGHIVWVLCRGSVVEWDEDGKPVRMIGTHTDITNAIMNTPTKIKMEREEKYGQS